jgi:hypothetical protein
MPTVDHETYVCAFDNMMAPKLSEAAQQTGAGSRFVPLGSAKVRLNAAQAKIIGADTGLAVPGSYLPDASWRLDHPGRRTISRPGLVLEVCVTQSLEDAMEKVHFYLGSTNGAVRGVIIIDLTRKGRRASVTACVADCDSAPGNGDTLTIRHNWLMEDKVGIPLAPCLTCTSLVVSSPPPHPLPLHTLTDMTAADPLMFTISKREDDSPC